MNRSKTALYDQIIYCEGMKDNVAVEVAMQHNDSYSDNTYGFVNNITTPEGGTHIVGFRNALTKTFNDYARKNKLLKDSEPNLSGEDISCLLYTSHIISHCFSYRFDVKCNREILRSYLSIILIRSTVDEHCS